jgi:hypothetical protein
MSDSFKRHSVALFFTLSVLGISMFAATAQAACGPYADVSVTGSTNGIVWGSGPYGERSDFGAAAVHAGLIDVGVSAVVRRTSVGARTLADSTENGVSSLAYAQSMRGYFE